MQVGFIKPIKISAKFQTNKSNNCLKTFLKNEKKKPKLSKIKLLTNLGNQQLRPKTMWPECTFDGFYSQNQLVFPISLINPNPNCRPLRLQQTLFGEDTMNYHESIRLSYSIHLSQPSDEIRHRLF